MAQHAFVAMPFGTKQNSAKQDIDFNRIYEEYIRPALEGAGFEVFRADEEQRAGNIRTDMFQELLMADLVVADLTINNPNVWYELGVRHALRSRGVILINGGTPTPAFDIYANRKLVYGLVDGALTKLDDDKKALTTMVRDTVEAWHLRKTSPV